MTKTDFKIRYTKLKNSTIDVPISERLMFMSAEEMKRKARAFVLIEVKPGKEKRVMEKLLKFNEVREVHICPGETDIIAVLETKREILVPSSKKIGDFIIDKIGSIGEIRNTKTIIPTYSKTKWPESL